MIKYFFSALLLSVLNCFTAKADDLVIYPVPQNLIYSQHNDDFTVRVRKPGGEWKDLFEFDVKVDLDKPQQASMVYFDFSGSVEVAVTKNNGDFNSVSIRPFANKINTKKNGRTVFFTLTEPKKLSIEFDGDRLHNLHLFANPIETEKPSPNDPNVIYFGPGLHQPKDMPGDAIHIPSGKTVYIDGGAVIKAKLVCDQVSNVKIMGRGILFQPVRGIEIRNSNNVSIEGITIINPKHYTVYGGGSTNITIKNIKSFSAEGWSDGIDLMSCSNVNISDIFMRNSDDCIAIYGHRWEFYGDVRNYKISDAILWADVAHPINIGLHGDTSGEGEIIENLHFKNIDILEHDEDDPNYQGCIAITDGDANLVKNVSFEDIRIDDFQEGQLFNIRVVNNEKYNTGPGRGVENIRFKNIFYKGLNLMGSTIDGIDNQHHIKGITFENLNINDKLILKPEDGFIKIGAHVSEISFKK
ncbi:glycosyl hydrolase family 28 protein [Pelobium manganitolerans]|uniref:glycosyl hydrolase family 28 protein n=1 Tax=Pelobium manganitolerans TaxID=1842495 RepID=UPI003FA34BF2